MSGTGQFQKHVFEIGLLRRDFNHLKSGGGDNGHNGLRSMTASLGSRDYLRVRVGIGRPPGRQDPADYVLKDFSAAERKDRAFHVDPA